MPIFNIPLASTYGENVKPYDGALLNFYKSGTTTRKTTYSDSAQTVANTNPVVADGDGRFGTIYLSGIYKVVLTDKNSVQIWEVDAVQSEELVSVFTAAQWTSNDSTLGIGAYGFESDTGRAADR